MKKQKNKYEIDIWEGIEWRIRCFYAVILLVIIFLVIALVVLLKKSGVGTVLPISIVSFIFLIIFGILLKEVYIKVLFYAPIVLVPIGALAITYCVVWNWSDDVLKKAEILEFAGQFLAFCGAFCLGYFIFANEQVKRREKQSEDISLLKDIMFNADIDLINLRNASESGKSDKELKGKIGLITTEKDWRRYYREYEHLYGKNSELKIALGIYFDRIDKINLLINEGMYIEANDFNQRCINDDFYNTMDYNPSGLLLELESNRKIWYKQKNTKKQILYICDKYADIIEILIYNYLIINGLERCDANSVKKVITDRLIEESGDIRNMVRFPTEKRIITKAIEICSYGFKSHSKCHKIELVWGEYILYGKEE